MRTEQAFVGAHGVDSLPFSQNGTQDQANALKASGIDFFVGYLQAMNPQRLQFLHNAGLAFIPVTFAGNYDGNAAVKALHALGISQGCTVFLDLEGLKAFQTPPQVLETIINLWAQLIRAGGYQPGLYVGSPQPFTADELYRLQVVRYWKAPSRVVDRFGKSYDGPQCGFCMFQMWPQGTWKDTGVFVDHNIIGQDFQGRLPNWVVGV